MHKQNIQASLMLTLQIADTKLTYYGKQITYNVRDAHKQTTFIYNFSSDFQYM